MGLQDAGWYDVLGLLMRCPGVPRRRTGSKRAPRAYYRQTAEITGLEEGMVLARISVDNARDRGNGSCAAGGGGRQDIHSRKVVLVRIKQLEETVLRALLNWTMVSLFCGGGEKRSIPCSTEIVHDGKTVELWTSWSRLARKQTTARILSYR